MSTQEVRDACEVLDYPVYKFQNEWDNTEYYALLTATIEDIEATAVTATLQMTAEAYDVHLRTVLSAKLEKRDPTAFEEMLNAVDIPYTRSGMDEFEWAFRVHYGTTPEAALAADNRANWLAILTTVFVVGIIIYALI